MDYFEYKDNELFCEDVNLKDIAENYGTPSYVYSKKTLERHARAYIDSFSSQDHLVCFSVKSLSNIAILKVLKDVEMLEIKQGPYLLSSDKVKFEKIDEKKIKIKKI